MTTPTRRARTPRRTVAEDAQACESHTHSPVQREALWTALYSAFVANAGVSAAPPGQSTSSTDESIGGRRPAGESVDLPDPADPEERLGDGDAAHWLSKYTDYDRHWDEHHEKCRVVREAGWHLAALSCPPTHDPRGNRIVVTEEADWEFAERLLRDGEGWPLAEVAVHFRTLERIAAKIRREGGRHEDTGKTVTPVTDEQAVKRGRPARGTESDVDARMHEARKRRDGGESVLAISLSMKVDRRTVNRWLAKASDMGRAA